MLYQPRFKEDDKDWCVAVLDDDHETDTFNSPEEAEKAGREWMDSFDDDDRPTGVIAIVELNFKTLKTIPFRD